MAQVILRCTEPSTDVWMQRCAPPPSRTELLLALRDQGFGDCVVEESGFKRALTPLNEADPLDWVKVAEKRHGECRVLISPDKMTVTLDLTSPRGGRALSIEDMNAALTQHAVRFGFDLDAINDLHNRVAAARPGTTLTAIVAQGKEAVDGEPSRFEALVPTIKDRILKPRESDDGHVDYFDLGDIPTVEAGTPLMRRHPPTAGEPGRDVFGNVIAPTPGKNAEFDIAEGVNPSPADPNLLIAAAGGMPTPTARGMSVENVYRLKDVNTESGNVKFDGSVYITGDVGMHLKVESGSDVTVGGFVDTATLDAGGDVMIGKGITGGFAGNINQLQAHAHAEKNLWVRFAQFADLAAGGDLLAEKMLLHCRVQSAGAVKVGPEGVGVGKLVGGEIHAGDFVKTDVLGAENDIRTVLILGENFEALKQVIREAEAHIAKQTLVVANLKMLLDKPQRAGDEELKTRIRVTYEHTQKIIDQLRSDQSASSGTLQAAQERARVVITRRMFKGCEITIGDKTWKVSSECGPGTIVYSAHGLQFLPGVITLPKPKA